MTPADFSGLLQQFLMPFENVYESLQSNSCSIGELVELLENAFYPSKRKSITKAVSVKVCMPTLRLATKTAKLLASSSSCSSPFTADARNPVMAALAVLDCCIRALERMNKWQLIPSVEIYKVLANTSFSSVDISTNEQALFGSSAGDCCLFCSFEYTASLLEKFFSSP
jgi:hypothetical protein